MSDEQLANRLALVCALVIIAEYAALMLAGFVWDDFALVLCNAQTGSLAHIPKFFTMDLWMSIGPEPVSSGYYRPLMLAGLAVDRALWGFSAAGHHMHSVAWHVAASLALYALLRRLTPPIPAALGMAFFALHPMQSESVAWITARNDPMVAAFTFAALAALLPERPTGRSLVGGAFFAACALFSKESGVIVGPLLLMLDLARYRRPVGWPRYAALGGALALWWALREAAGLDPVSSPQRQQIEFLLQHAVSVAALYMGRITLPLTPTVGYSLDYLDQLPLHLWLGALLTGVAAVLALLRGRGLALAGLGFAALALAPALAAIAVRGQLGERYLYLPMGGVALALASAWPASRRAAAPFGVISLVFVLIVHERLPEWKDEITLWRAAVREVPSAYTWASLGHVLNADTTAKTDRSGCAPGTFKAPDELAQRDRTEAVLLFQRALREGNPPYRDVCWQVVGVSRKIRSKELIREGIALTESAHCPITREIASARTLGLIELGDWERVRVELARYANREEWANERWILLAQAALAQHDGDLATYERLRDAGPFSPGELDQGLSALLQPLN